MTVSDRLVSVGDTRLHVVEHGHGAALIILHGGPGLDHHMFGDYLLPLSDDFRLIFVDQRSQGRSDRTAPATWTIVQMARDVSDLARALGLDRYAVLGHSFGALVALQHAVDDPGRASGTVISSGFPSARYLEHVDRNLAAFEPEEIRDRVAASWEKETDVETAEEVGALLADQMPFHFRDPLDPRSDAYLESTSEAVYSPDVLRHFANQAYGGIEVEEELNRVSQPVLVLAGRYDRVCSVPAAEAIAAGVSHGELVVLEQSGHMTFVEENERYLEVVREFLDRVLEGRPGA